MAMQSPSEAEAFYDFLGHAIRQGDRDTPLDALMRKWRAEREFDETCEVIREGLANRDAGRGESAEDVFARLRAKHGIVDP